MSHPLRHLADASRRICRGPIFSNRQRIHDRLAQAWRENQMSLDRADFAAPDTARNQRGLPLSIADTRNVKDI